MSLLEYADVGVWHAFMIQQKM